MRTDVGHGDTWKTGTMNCSEHVRDMLGHIWDILGHIWDMYCLEVGPHDPHEELQREKVPRTY